MTARPCIVTPLDTPAWLPWSKWMGVRSGMGWGRAWVGQPLKHTFHVCRVVRCKRPQFHLFMCFYT